MKVFRIGVLSLVFVNDIENEVANNAFDVALKYLQRNTDLDIQPDVTRVMGNSTDAREFLDQLCKVYNDSLEEKKAPHVVIDTTIAGVPSEVVKAFTSALGLPTLSASHGQDGDLRVFTGKPNGKRPLGSPRSSWDYSNRMDLKEIGCNEMDCIELSEGDWIEVARDRDMAQNSHPLPSFILRMMFKESSPKDGSFPSHTFITVMVLGQHHQELHDSIKLSKQFLILVSQDQDCGKKVGGEGSVLSTGRPEDHEQDDLGIGKGCFCPYMSAGQWRNLDEEKSKFLIQIMPPADMLPEAIRSVVYEQNISNAGVLFDDSVGEFKVTVFTVVPHGLHLLKGNIIRLCKTCCCKREMFRWPCALTHVSVMDHKYKSLLQNLPTRHVIIKVNESMPVKKQIQKLRDLDIFNFFIVGRLSTIKDVLDNANINKFFAPHFAWHAFTLEDDQLRCSCKESTVIFLHPEPEPECKDRLKEIQETYGLEGKPDITSAFYFDFTLRALLAIKLARFIVSF
uniref:Uncharacterized protein n=1 Tax=Timema cristinae TaxID=61476 RepID=A0A7R9DAG2_TIMCR|nr:unnamed protein product [Timema cristinae]